MIIYLMIIVNYYQVTIVLKYQKTILFILLLVNLI